MIDDNNYEISNIENGLEVKKNNEIFSKKNISNVMPKTIFLYYCGETPRLKELALMYVDRAFDNAVKKGTEAVLKYITYLTVDDFGPALLANIVFQNQTCKKTFEIVNIENVVLPFIVKLKRPYWGKRGDPENFWNAQGSVLDVLNKLNEISQKIQILNKDSIDITIVEINGFKKHWHNAFELFMVFKMLMQADILQSVEFDVTKTSSDAIFSYTELSEGEKQLSQLLLILEITKEYKALFLLDEFDSYLHPNWQRRFTEIISDIDIRGQVVFTSHSPLTLSKMEKENVIVLKDGKAYNPAIDTFNRDISEILEETMEVGKRPVEVEEAIRNFRNTAIHGEMEYALKYYDSLKSLLSKDDPFFTTAEHLLERLKNR